MSFWHIRLLLLSGLLFYILPAHAVGVDSITSRFVTRLQSEDKAPAENLKYFGKDFDSDVALKVSQSAIGRVLSGYAFRDRDNHLIHLSDLRGKPVVLSLIYTSCYHICPATTVNLKAAVRQARTAVGNDTFRVLTVGFDTRQDTPERMRAFARQHGVSGDKNWKFLSADATTIKKFTAATGFIYVPSDKGFDHLIQTTIIDKTGRIYQQIYGMSFDPAQFSEILKQLIFGLQPTTISLSALINRARLFCTSYDPSTGTYKFRFAMVFGMVIGTVLMIGGSIILFRFLRNA